MKITIQSIRFDADIKLLNFIQKKSNKLDQYFDHIVSGVVYLKLAKVEDEANKICEIKLSVPGGTMFAKAQCKSFEEATDLSVESLIKQIIRHKAKNRAKSFEHKDFLRTYEVAEY